MEKQNKFPSEIVELPQKAYCIQKNHLYHPER